MKIRTGFVSNSSSSSFVISTSHFPTIKDLAIYMIQQQMDERDDSDPQWHEKFLEKNREYIERLEKVDENQAISFPSCNYDTYIKKVGDVYLVATCNNTDWNLWKYTTRLTNIAKEELKKIQNLCPKNNEDWRSIDYILDDDSEFSHFGNDYYNLYKDLIGVETYEECPKRDKSIYEWDHYLWDTPRYGKICPKCNPYYKRKDKLDIINQVAKEE